MREDLVVQGEVVAGNDVDTGILLDLPVGQTQALGLSEQVGLGDLATPVWTELVSDEADKLEWNTSVTYKPQSPSSGHGSHPCGGNRGLRTEPSCQQ